MTRGNNLDHLPEERRPERGGGEAALSTARGAEADRLMGEEEVAQRYGVSPHTVRRWRREGRIRFLKLGRQVRFRPEDLEEFERSSEVAPVVVGR